MKKLLTTLVAVLLFIFTVSTVFAQGTQQQNRVQDPETHVDGTPSAQGNLIQNENQVQTQNKGEDVQLMVATQQMQNLMEMEGLDEEVGNQLKNIAQQQIQAQTQIQTQLDKIETRAGLMKTLFGPDFSAIRNLKVQMEQNKLRIQELAKLKNQIENEAETSQLEEAISALTAQNTSLQEQVEAEEQVGSIFGWLVKLFY